MRRVVAYELLSLDGVAEDPDDFITDWDDEMRLTLSRATTTPTGHLLLDYQVRS